MTGAPAAQSSGETHRDNHESHNMTMPCKSPIIVSSSMVKANSPINPTTTQASSANIHQNPEPLNMIAPGESKIIQQKPVIVSSSTFPTRSLSTYVSMSGETIHYIFSYGNVVEVGEIPITPHDAHTFNGSIYQLKAKADYIASNATGGTVGHDETQQKHGSTPGKLVWRDPGPPIYK